jgi:N-acetylglucosaminyl-diphospho-decaprenol L-rhamnosyltransferase
MKLSVIIVSYNVKYFLEQCLHAVLRAAASIEAEVLVIDNNSTDGSLEYLPPLFPAVKFIPGEQNLGFAKANNLALRQATGEYILFLNPDTLVPEDCFTKCAGFLDNNPRAGALGIRMLDGSGNFLPESKRSFPTTATAFYKAIGLSAMFPRSRLFNKYALGYLGDKENHLVDVLAGAYMMVRSSVLDKTGAFDERFFMYGEDIDLSYRIRLAGFENWYFAGASIIHFKGESLKKWSANHVKVFYDAMIIFVKKHYTGPGASLFRMMLVAGIKARSFLSLLNGTLSEKKISNRGRDDASCVIVGTRSEYDECHSIFQKEGKHKIQGWIQADAEHSLLPGELKSYSSDNQVTMIVFCIGHLQCKFIISLMERLGPSFSYRFHEAGSGSIVGSDSKSGLGEAITL